MSKENCNEYLRKQFKDHPRTCRECGLGKCKYLNFDKETISSPVKTDNQDKHLVEFTD